MSKGLRILGHPLHAMLSDFPVPLLGTSLLWDFLGILRHEPLWWAISFWNIALGLGMALLAAAAGLIDYAAIPDGDPATKTGTCHMAVMLTAVSLYAAALLIRGGAAPPQGKALAATLALEALGFLLISIGGWLGGHLVFHFGIGRD